MTEIQSLLAQALTELPGGPIATPVGLAAKGARRRVVRRRVTVLASVGAMLAVGGAAVTLTSGARHESGVAGSSEPVVLTTCQTPAGLSPAPATRRPEHSAVEIRDSVREAVRLKPVPARADSVGSAMLTLRAGRLVWAVEQLTVTSGPGRFGSLWLVPDADPAARRSAPCVLRRSLDGTTLDPPGAFVRAGEATTLLPQQPVQSLTREDASVRWSFGGIRSGGRELQISYGTGCHESPSVQVEQTSTYVLVQLVRHGPPSYLECLTGEAGRLLLDAPLGDRVVLHAPLREILPSKAYQRTPSYLPPGAISVSDTVNHSLRTRIWSLPGGRRLSLFVGIRSIFDRAPHPLPLASYTARSGTFRGQPDLAWEEGGVPLELRVTAGSVEDLVSVAESLYTEEYVGLTLEQATALAASYGLDVTTARSGLTSRPRRIRFTVRDGRVSAASFA